MKAKYVIGILGDGRIARAVASFLKAGRAFRVTSIGPDGDARGCDLIVGALPGELGERGLRLALRYRKNLVDISDVDPPFYLRHKKEIRQSGITVVPGCGFSPGLVNCILGFELSVLGSAGRIEIKAGSLSRKKYYYPFLWCFEDLVLEHRISSRQLLDGINKKCPPFAGYREENILGIEAESYYCASGFENILDKFGAQTIVTRVVRPRGFRDFFRFMQSYNFFSPEHMGRSKAMLEAVADDNITLSQISFDSGKTQVRWMLRSSSSKGEELNSMQKITASVPAIMARRICEGALPRRGLLFMEEIGAENGFLKSLVGEIKGMGVSAQRSVKR